MQAIILAAGIGKRLNNTQEDKIPKCLLEIGDKTLIEYILDALEALDIRQIVIVVGYLKEKIIAFLKDKYKNIRINFVENKLFAVTGSLYSLALAEQQLDKIGQDDLIFMDADLLLHPDLLAKIVKTRSRNALFYGPARQLGQEEVKVYGRGNLATGIGKKTMSKNRLMGEAVGIVKIAGEKRALLKNLIKQILRLSIKAEHEDLTQKLCEKGILNLISTEGLPWIEIDFAQDLKRAKDEIWPKIRKK